MDFHQEKHSCNADIEMHYGIHLPLLKKQQNAKKKFEGIDPIFGMCMKLRHRALGISKN